MMNDIILYFHGPWQHGDGISDSIMFVPPDNEKIAKDKYFVEMEYWNSFLDNVLNGETL